MSTEEFKTYFSGLVDSHSWSTVKVDLHGLRFFFDHALKREWPWVDLIRPPGGWWIAAVSVTASRR